MKKPTKYIYGFKLFVNYGQGWEYEIFEESRKEILTRVKEYRENCPQYPVKFSKGREPNPEYIQN